ncbi:hypothetical protein DID78_05310 [Candidatus Marinamargulisbacteria bacterium SCGC AG-343-D04]|nr:hypothetical protein DID78_05310 [Candidatus Marinamargulisbacteria bacterium SCGC AG-343-D04]
MQFSKLVSTPRASALGDAVTALNTSHAVYINPASIASQKGSMLTSQLFHYVEDISYKSMQFTHAFENTVLGISYNWLDYGAYSKTTTSDKEGAHSGSVSNSSKVVVFTMARRFFNVNTGLSFKSFREKLANYKAKQSSLDLGLLWSVNSQFSLGASINDISLSKAVFINDEASLEQVSRIGMSLKPRIFKSKIHIMTDAILKYNSDLSVASGIDISLHPKCSVRAGFTTISDIIGPTFGLGFLSDSFECDFSYRPSKVFNDIYRMALNLYF